MPMSFIDQENAKYDWICEVHFYQTYPKWHTYLISVVFRCAGKSIGMSTTPRDIHAIPEISYLPFIFFSATNSWNYHKEAESSVVLFETLRYRDWFLNAANFQIDPPWRLATNLHARFGHASRVGCRVLSKICMMAIVTEVCEGVGEKAIRWGLCCYYCRCIWSSFFAWSVKWGLWIGNPFRAVPVPEEARSQGGENVRLTDV